MNFPVKRKLIFPSNVQENEKKNGFPFRIMQYNILAQGLMNRKNYTYVKKEYARWKFRKNNLLKEIINANADIICISEMDYFEDFWKIEFKKIGYSSVYQSNYNKQKKKNQPWGICIAFKNKIFKKVSYEVIGFNTVKNDLSNSFIETLELDFSTNFSQFLCLSTNDFSFLVVNTHFYWRPGFEWVRMRHLIKIHEKLRNYRSLIPIICGDFNLSPIDLPVRLFTGERDLSKLEEYVKYFKIHEYVFKHNEEKIKNCSDSVENLVIKRNESVKEKIKDYFKNYPIFYSVYCNYAQLDETAEKTEWCLSEPAFTNFRDCYVSTLDYIFILKEHLESGLIVIKSLLEIPKKEVLSKEVALPNSQFSSDHICIFSDFMLYKQKEKSKNLK